MSDEPLRALVTAAVARLRSAVDLTMDEVIGLDHLPAEQQTPAVCFALGVIAGAATALRVTQRELLEELDLLTAPARHA